MKSIFYVFAGLLGIFLVACSSQEAADLPKENQPEVEQSLSEYDKNLPGIWIHDMAYMKKESLKFRNAVTKMAKDKNSAELPEEFNVALNSITTKIEQDWQDWEIEFFRVKKNQHGLKAKVKSKNGNPVPAFNVGVGKDRFSIILSLPDTSGKYNWAVMKFEEPHLYKDALIWREITRIPDTDSDLIITHRCIRVQ